MEADMWGPERGYGKKSLSGLWKDTCHSNVRKRGDNWSRCGVSDMQ